jgi:hypothetical protein
VVELAVVVVASRLQGTANSPDGRGTIVEDDERYAERVRAGVQLEAKRCLAILPNAPPQRDRGHCEAREGDAACPPVRSMGGRFRSHARTLTGRAASTECLPNRPGVARTASDARHSDVSTTCTNADPAERTRVNLDSHERLRA